MTKAEAPKYVVVEDTPVIKKPKVSKKKETEAKPPKRPKQKDAKKSVPESKDKQDFNPMGFRYIDPKGVYKPLELKRYIDWYTMPSQERNPKTKKDLALELGVEQDTLTRWSHMKGFFDEVQGNLKSWYLAEASDVLRSMTLSAKTGNPKNIRTYLEYIVGFAQKFKLEDETPERELTPERIAEIKDKLKRWSLPAVRKP